MRIPLRVIAVLCGLSALLLLGNAVFGVPASEITSWLYSAGTMALCGIVAETANEVLGVLHRIHAKLP